MSDPTTADSTSVVVPDVVPQNSAKPIKLNNKQRKLVKAMAAGKSLTEASFDAGYSSRCNGHTGLRRVREKFPQVMERLGLTDDVLISNYLIPTLSATQTVFAQHEGVFTDQRETAAWHPRTKALDMAFQLKGSYAPKPAFGGIPEGHEVSITIKHIGSE